MYKRKTFRQIRNHFSELDHECLVGYSILIIVAVIHMLYGTLSDNLNAEWVKFVGLGLFAAAAVSMINPHIGWIFWILWVLLLVFYECPIDPAYAEIIEENPEYGESPLGYLIFVVYSAGPVITFRRCQLRKEEKKAIRERSLYLRCRLQK